MTRASDRINRLIGWMDGAMADEGMGVTVDELLGDDDGPEQLPGSAYISARDPDGAVVAQALPIVSPLCEHIHEQSCASVEAHPNRSTCDCSAGCSCPPSHARRLQSRHTYTVDLGDQVMREDWVMQRWFAAQVASRISDLLESNLFGSTP